MSRTNRPKSVVWAPAFDERIGGAIALHATVEAFLEACRGRFGAGR